MNIHVKLGDVLVLGDEVLREGVRFFEGVVAKNITLRANSPSGDLLAGDARPSRPFGIAGRRLTAPAQLFSFDINNVARHTESIKVLHEDGQDPNQRAERACWWLLGEE